MEEAGEEGFDIDKDDFGVVVQKFKSKKTHSYDFLLNAGDKYKESMCKFCKKIIERERFPVGFRKTLLFMIWKQKGPADILNNSRFIHLKDGFLPRTCEALVVEKMKQCILNSSSKY